MDQQLADNADASISNRLEDLPTAIMQIILEKLAFQCLFRFRFITKSFYASMNNMSFSPMEPILYVKCQNSLYFMRLDSMAYREYEHKIVYKPMQVLSLPLPNCYIIGSCTGYLCLSSSSSPSPDHSNGQSNTLIFNPFIPRDVKNLPSSSMDLAWAFGFGIDQETNEHKVVRICYERDGNSCKQNAQVSNMGESHWRSVKTLNGVYIRSRTATFARGIYLENGCIYWLGERHPKKSPVIVEFSLSREEFKEIAPPGGETTFKDGEFYLVKRRGQLALVVINHPKDELSIWVMEDQFSWRKSKFVRLKIIKELLNHVDPETYYYSTCYNKTLYDVIWLEHDKLLLQFEKSILCYDLARNKFIDFEVEGLPNLGGTQQEFQAAVGLGSVMGIERCT